MPDRRPWFPPLATAEQVKDAVRGVAETMATLGHRAIGMPPQDARESEDRGDYVAILCSTCGLRAYVEPRPSTPRGHAWGPALARPCPHHWVAGKETRIQLLR